MNIDPSAISAAATIITVLFGIAVSHTKTNMRLKSNGDRLNNLETKLFGNGQKGLNERVIELETRVEERTGD